MNDSGKMKPDAEMEPSARMKAVAEQAAGIVINPSTKATQYIRSGKEMLRSAVNYHEDGNTECAYVLYMRFLTIFLEKLRTHPGYKEIPPSEKKLMNSYCNDILPKAEALKAELLSKYETEYEDHKIHVQQIIQRKEKAREEALKNAERNKSGGTQPRSEDKVTLPEWDNKWPYQHTPSAPSVFLPDPKSLSMGGTGLPLSGVFGASYSEILDDGPGPSGSGGVPQFDRRTKPGRFLSPMSTGFRQVVVPDDLIPEFLKVADKNTSKNTETCGLLTGKIMAGKLVITDLIIPKQTGTSDSCTTHNEEEYSIIQDKFDLITFGWIHTHPSQTAFLSSIDLHTHYWYQSMMPEAIAIVCAPKKHEVGTFILTPNGMEIIGNCHLTNFHPHPSTGTPLFVEASHNMFDSTKKVRVHDIRNN